MSDAATGLTLAAPFGTLADLVADHARARPHAIALVAGGARLSYGALEIEYKTIAVTAI